MDYDKAKNFLELAVKQGKPSAMNYLGTMYFDGKGVTKDENKAIPLFQKSCSEGDSNACDKLKEIGAFAGIQAGGNVSGAIEWFDPHPEDNNNITQDKSKQIINKETKFTGIAKLTHGVSNCAGRDRTVWSFLRNNDSLLRFAQYGEEVMENV